MSLGDVCQRTARLGFPRVSGDEPNNTGKLIYWTRFSPRERG